MKNLLIRTAVIGLVASLSWPAIAWASASSTPPANGEGGQSDLITLNCPEPSALVKNTTKMTFASKGGWKSYERSFVTQVDTFKGAQWQGINVGQVMCVYTGKPAGTFPIYLYFDHLTLTPNGGNWVAQKGQYSNCGSKNRNDCPITVRLPPKQQNMYQEATDLKKNAPPPQLLQGY